jgi:diacylglycerol kinase family enzyme|tara:strand:- start:43653 stop:43895 length:243 start_codon:yes stop_codon:yes gene_type:complete
LRAIAIKLFKYRKKKVKITSDQWNYTGISLDGAFANSGSFGRGIVISPDAKIDDGILNISHIGNIGMLENVKYIIPLKKW